MGNLRIAPHASVFASQLSIDQALENIEALMSRPHVRTPGEDEGFWEALRSTVTAGAARGLIPDAHLVTLMRRSGVTDLGPRS